jgi:urease accessory protein
LWRDGILVGAPARSEGNPDLTCRLIATLDARKDAGKMPALRPGHPRSVSHPSIPRLQRSDGAAELGLRRRDGITALAHLFQSDPCRVLFPLPDPDDAFQAVMLTTSGGLTDGDRARLSVDCAEDVAAVVTSQAAEKIYRAAGDEACRIDVTLSAGAGASLEWLPQETIVFDGARLRRTTEADLRGDARLLACEMVVLGRTESGESFTRGLVHDAWRLRRDGRLVWADALRLEGAPPDAAGFDGATAIAFALYSGPAAPDLLARSRSLIEAIDTGWPALRSGTTLVNGILLARFLGHSKDVRGALTAWLAAMRHTALGRPAQLPRIWHV